MRIGIDAMGGDNAPASVIAAVEIFCQKDKTVNIFLYGDEDLLQREMMGKLLDEERVEIVHCSEMIEGDDEPVKAIRTKKDSTIVRACKDLRHGEIDAFLSSGNTGALLAGGTTIVGRLKGIKRACLCSVVPTRKSMSVFADIGANSECTAENLYQFAVMSSFYTSEVLGISNPTVALANIGIEKTKGTQVQKDAYKLLDESKEINFIGNIEANEIPAGYSDVVITDGFVGNIILKLTEGLAKNLFGMIKEAISTSLKSKIGGALIKSSLKSLKTKMDYASYGGAPLLGLKKPVIKAHGSSDYRAIFGALEYTKKYYDSNMIQKLKDQILDDKENKREKKSKDEPKKPKEIENEIMAKLDSMVKDIEIKAEELESLHKNEETEEESTQPETKEELESKEVESTQSEEKEESETKEVLELDLSEDYDYNSEYEDDDEYDDEYEKEYLEIDKEKINAKIKSKRKFKKGGR